MDEPPRDRDPGLAPRPPRRVSLASLGLVWLGGSAGTAARYLIGRVVPQPSGVPVATVAINVLGACALGFLLESLGRRRPDPARGSRLRLLLGTGFLGGFTTYSALAVDTVWLARSGTALLAVVYASVTVVVGALAALAGVALSARRGRRA
jgi:fluoride exporter